MATQFYLHCRKCRTRVAEVNHVLQTDDQKEGDKTGIKEECYLEIIFQMHFGISCPCDFIGRLMCNSNTVWYISEDNMPEWISNAVDQEAWQRGKLYCPKCKGRLGSFNFIKLLSCPDCQQHSLPAVHILKDRVDRKMDIKIQGCYGQNVGTQKGKIHNEMSRSDPVDNVAINACSFHVPVCQNLTTDSSNVTKEVAIHAFQKLVPIPTNMTNELDINSSLLKDLENYSICSAQPCLSEAENVSGNTLNFNKNHRISDLAALQDDKNQDMCLNKNMSNINEEHVWVKSEKNCGIDSAIDFSDVLKTGQEHDSRPEHASQSWMESENIQNYSSEKCTPLIVNSQHNSLPSLSDAHVIKSIHDFDQDSNHMDLAEKEHFDVDIDLFRTSLSGKTSGRKYHTESHCMNLELIGDMNNDGLLYDSEGLDRTREQFSEIRNLVINTAFTDEHKIIENLCQNEVGSDFKTKNPEIFMQTIGSEITLSENENLSEIVNPSNDPDNISLSNQENNLVAGHPMIQGLTSLDNDDDNVSENSLNLENPYACLNRETTNTNLESSQLFLAGNNMTEHPELHHTLENNNLDSSWDMDVDIIFDFDFLETNERPGRKRRNRRVMRQEEKSKRIKEKKDAIQKATEDLYEPWLIDFPVEHLCPVCFDLFCEPHGCYPCDHVLCEGCLRRLGQNNVNNTPCPMCRQHIVDCIKKKDLVETLKELYPDEYRARLREQRKYLNSKFSPLPHRRTALEQTQEDIRNRILGSNRSFRYHSNLPLYRVKLVLTGFLLLVCFVPAVSLGKAVMNSAYGLVHDLITWL